MKTWTKESSEFGEAQMLEMAKIADIFTDIMAEDFITIEQMEEVTGKIFTSDDEIATWLNICYDLKQERLQPWDEPGLIDEFKIVAWKQWAVFKKNPPPLSVVGSMHFKNPNERTNRVWVVREIFTVGLEPGATGYIYGVPGSGKSNLAVAEFYEPMTHEDCRIDVNIPIRDLADNAKFNTKLSGTLLHGAEYAAQSFGEGKQDYTLLWINDEAQVARDRQRSGSDRNVFMKQANLVGRKLGFDQISILQQDKPPSEVKEFSTHIIKKTSRAHKDWADLEINSNVYVNMKLRGIPSAEERGITYQSKSMYVYDVDINPLRMLDYISSMTDSTGMLDEVRQFEDIIKYIKSHRGEKLDIISDDVIASLLYRARKRLINSEDSFEKRMSSYNSLGMLVGWNSKKVERWIKKIAEHVREGGIVVTDTDDFIGDISGAVEPPDLSDIPSDTGEELRSDDIADQ